MGLNFVYLAVNPIKNTRVFLYFICLLTCFMPSFAVGLLNTLFDPDIKNFSIEIESKSKKEKKNWVEIFTTDIIELRKSQKTSSIHINTIAQIRLEKQLIVKRAYALGYYDVKVNTQSAATNTHIIETEKKQTKGARYSVILGTAYTIESIDYDSPIDVFALAKKPPISEYASDLNINNVGDKLIAKNINQEKSALSKILVNRSCLYSVDVSHTIILSKKTKTARVVFKVKSSPSVTIGEIAYNGAKNIKRSYLRSVTKLEQGNCFNRQKIDQVRLRLIQTNLLLSANVRYSEPSPVDSTVDVVFQLLPRLNKTIEVGLGFDADDGAGASLGWEHRNIFGRAENLHLDTVINRNTQSLNAEVRIPFFKKRHQRLSLFSNFENEKSDAFDSQTGLVGIELRRSLTTHLDVSIGTELAYSRVDSLQDDTLLNEAFTLFSLPLEVQFDRRNNVLDPSRGWVASAALQPFWDTKDVSRIFTKTTLASSRYIEFKDLKFMPILAIRGALGAIAGTNIDEVPINYRYFAGGGGSVRGFSYQSLGPKTDEVPTGGLSFTEVSAETRFRLNKNWGAVVFVDGGMAYDANVPDFSNSMRFGVGVGLRFFTSFAPIRVDIASPLAKEEGEDSIQLYISIGQAF